MPPPNYSRSFSSESARASVFARSASFSASSGSVIVFAGYRLLLVLFNINSYSFIRSINIRSTQFKQSINKYSSNVYPCKTPATISKKLVSPKGKRTIAFVFM